MKNSWGDFVHLPMSYLLPSSLFWQKHLGSPSPFTLFSVHVLLCLGAQISGHWGYPFQAAGNPFWKHCWHQGVKICILLLSCLFLCSANFAFCSGLHRAGSSLSPVCLTEQRCVPQQFQLHHHKGPLGIKVSLKSVLASHTVNLGTPLCCVWGCFWSSCCNIFVCTLSSPCCGDGLDWGSPLGQKN